MSLVSESLEEDSELASLSDELSSPLPLEEPSEFAEEVSVEEEPSSSLLSLPLDSSSLVLVLLLLLEWQGTHTERLLCLTLVASSRIGVKRKRDSFF